MAKANASKAATKTTTKATKTTEVKKGAIYSFCGEYYSKTGNDVKIGRYELDVVFPELLQAPLSVFKGSVDKVGHPINTLMIKKYPDFSRVRTYNVMKVVNNTGSSKGAKNTIELMDIEQLKNYIAEKDLIIDTEIYDNSVELVRVAIKQAEADPEAFAPIYAKAVEDYKYKKELEALNGTGNDNEDNSDIITDETGEDGDINDLLDDLDGENEGDNGDDE